MKQQIVKVTVTAPEGRFIPDLGGRELGGFYELPEKQAKALVKGDPGLMLEPVESERAADQPVEGVNDGQS